MRGKSDGFSLRQAPYPRCILKERSDRPILLEVTEGHIGDEGSMMLDSLPLLNYIYSTPPMQESEQISNDLFGQYGQVGLSRLHQNAC